MADDSNRTIKIDLFENLLMDVRGMSQNAWSDDDTVVMLFAPKNARMLEAGMIGAIGVSFSLEDLETPIVVDDGTELMAVIAIDDAADVLAYSLEIKPTATQQELVQALNNFIDRDEYHI